MDSNGAFLFDRDPKYFGPILNYLRTNRLIVDAGISYEGLLQVNFEIGGLAVVGADRAEDGQAGAWLASQISGT